METQSPNDRRVHERVESSDLADLEMYDQNGSFVYRTMGLVRNVSKGGLLLETHVALDPTGIVVAVLDVDNELIETAGKAVHVSPCGANHYCIGLEFLDDVCCIS